MKIKLGLVALACAVMFSNCGMLVGSIYTDVTNNATLINKDMSEKESLGSKTGEACASSILNIIATGDAGIKAAARAGGITNVRGMDSRNMSILGSLYVEHCTLVHGD